MVGGKEGEEERKGRRKGKGGGHEWRGSLIVKLTGSYYPREESNR
jgi:hypothetical protein